MKEFIIHTNKGRYAVYAVNKEAAIEKLREKHKDIKFYVYVHTHAHTQNKFN